MPMLRKVRASRELPHMLQTPRLRISLAPQSRDIRTAVMPVAPQPMRAQARRMRIPPPTIKTAAVVVVVTEALVAKVDLAGIRLVSSADLAVHRFLLQPARWFSAAAPAQEPRTTARRTRRTEIPPESTAAV